MYAALAALVAALVALAIYHRAVVRPALSGMRSLVDVHDQLIGGGAGAAERLASLDSALAEARTTMERVEGRVGELEALARTDVSRVGFVRYDAFDDTGSELSYAMALLNREGSGVVISSIYSRSDTRTFGKAVDGYKPAVNASEEELLAIERARTSTKV
ncbi:MAG TPA: DUF4446 family protein [Candidatus Baltobacteraceae bacterium]|jgi:hypothetical protein|nr:DUF4446 family protein [Candidatus Baltobacteraceae bacterium]